jgi:hypothetical protein
MSPTPRTTTSHAVPTPAYPTFNWADAKLSAIIEDLETFLATSPTYTPTAPVTTPSDEKEDH